LKIQYADYSCWQRKLLEGEALQRQLEYWKRRLAGAPEALDLPIDHPRPAVQTFRGGEQQIEISETLWRGLRQLSRRQGSTLFMTLMAAWQTLLSRYTGEEDISLGTPIAGRHRLELESLIGFFANTLVLRTDLSCDPTFVEVLHRAREAVLAAHAHQDLPFEKLVQELQPQRSLSHTPLFQVMIALDNTPRSD